MSRLRVDSSHFADSFTRPLSLTRLPSPEPGFTVAESSQAVSESTEKLRSLLGSLKPPVSQAAVDDALEYLANADGGENLTADDEQEHTLKSAVVSQIAVGLYARGLDLFLNEATELEAEAEWWANIERSLPAVAWFLLQTLPSRLLRVFRTILDALRAQRLPLRLSALTPSALLRLLPPTAVRPSALTSAFFPHLAHEQTFALWSRPSKRTPTHYLRSIWSALFLPLDLTREECRSKRRALEKLRDERAEQLGALVQLRLSEAANAFPSQLATCISGAPFEPLATDNVEHVQRLSSSLLPAHTASHAHALQPLRRPSRLILLWPTLVLLPPIALYTARTLYASRDSIVQMAGEAKATAAGFVRNSLLEPLREVLKTVRTGGEDGVIVHKEGVAADLESLERMTLALARDELHYTPTQLSALAQQIRVGDLTPVLQLYEEDIKRPLKSAVTGTLLRSVFIQVQKAKVDIDQALAGIDKLLKSQELTFAFVGLAPALVVVALLGRSVSGLWRGSGQGRLGGAARRAGAWAAMRRIERLLVLQPRVASSIFSADPSPAAAFPASVPSPSADASLTPLTTGLLLLSVSRLRAFAEALPRGSGRLRAGFLEDVGDLEDPGMPRAEKLRVVERMWRCWGGVLGWERVGGEA
ncbi:NCA2-domain-containing protein [Mycena belliarum]|uniref:NCA2-domain-containing protein n=1 Tax=Mycena belliarum TaxID=1033014 RepID=A0AAD6TR06_9AGAR|nr:NCA2-domain-containing protein [Mycena belliae]